MVPSVPAPVTRSNVKWYESTYEIDGKSVRVEYLSDRALNNGQIADLVARGNDYGMVFINGRGQSTQRAIASATELIQGAGEPTETGVARINLSQAEIDRSNGLRTLEAARPAAGRMAESFIEVGQQVASAIGLRPASTGQIERERQEMQQASVVRGGRSRPGEPVTGTARGETARVVSAAEEVTIPETRPQAPAPAETPAQPTERRSQASYITTPHYTMRGTQGVAYEFEVVYDSSRPGVGIPPVSQYGYADASFFDRPENREGIARYRYRRAGEEGGADWSEWQAPGRNGQEFHRDFMKFSRTPIRYEVRDAEGVVARFNLYIDQEVAQRVYGTRNEEETRRRIMEDLSNAEDPLKFLRELQEKGLIAGFSTLAGEGAETVWVRGNINNFIAALERTYGRDASSLGFAQA